VYENVSDVVVGLRKSGRNDLNCLNLNEYKLVDDKNGGN